MDVDVVNVVIYTVRSERFCDITSYTVRAINTGCQWVDVGVVNVIIYAVRGERFCNITSHTRNKKFFYCNLTSI